MSNFPEEKIVLVVDRDKTAAAQRVLREVVSPSNKTICILVGPWGGIEDFVENHLSEPGRHQYRTARTTLSKRRLAETYAPRLAASTLAADPWILDNLLRALECHCPPGSCLVGHA
ncbi:MAG: hypothetical protein AB1486_05620 [Planctomycetota bacterium]